MGEAESHHALPILQDTLVKSLTHQSTALALQALGSTTAKLVRAPAAQSAITAAAAGNAVALHLDDKVHIAARVVVGDWRVGLQDVAAVCSSCLQDDVLPDRQPQRLARVRQRKPAGQDSVLAGTQNTASQHKLPACYTPSVVRQQLYRWCYGTVGARTATTSGWNGTREDRECSRCYQPLAQSSWCTKSANKRLKGAAPAAKPATHTVPKNTHLNRRVLCVSSFLSTSGSCFQVAGSRKGGGWRGRSAKAATISTRITAAATSASPPSIARAAKPTQTCCLCQVQSVQPPLEEETVHLTVSAVDGLRYDEHAASCTPPGAGHTTSKQQAGTSSEQARSTCKVLHRTCKVLNTLRGPVLPNLSLQCSSAASLAAT